LRNISISGLIFIEKYFDFDHNFSAGFQKDFGSVHFFLIFGHNFNILKPFFRVCLRIPSSLGRPWREAVDVCGTYDADLVEILDESQQEAVNGFLKNEIAHWSENMSRDYVGVWIGLTTMHSGIIRNFAQ